MVGLMYVPVMIVLTFMKIPFATVIGSVYIASITSLFYVMIPMIAIEPITSHYLRKSVQLIKGNYMSVLALTFITTTLLAILNGIAIYIFQGKTAELFIIGIIYAAIYFFVYPFASTVTVIVYRQLKKGKNESVENVDGEPIEHI